MMTDERLLSAVKPRLSVNFPLLTEEHIHQTHTTYVCTVQLCKHTPHARHTCALTECAPPGRDSTERLKAIKTIICSGSGQARGCEGELPLYISLSVSATHSDMRRRCNLLPNTHRHGGPRSACAPDDTFTCSCCTQFCTKYAEVQMLRRFLSPSENYGCYSQ